MAKSGCAESAKRNKIQITKTNKNEYELQITNPKSTGAMRWRDALSEQGRLPPNHQLVKRPNRQNNQGVEHT